MSKLGFLEAHRLCLDVIDGKVNAKELVEKIKLSNWDKTTHPNVILELTNIELSLDGSYLHISTMDRC